MTAPILAAAIFCIATTLIHVATIVIAIVRLSGSLRRESLARHKFPPPAWWAPYAE
jgi:hypothetical protein